MALRELLRASKNGSYYTPSSGRPSSFAPRSQAGHSCPPWSGASVGTFRSGVWRPEGARATGRRRTGEGSDHEPHRGGVGAFPSGGDRAAQEKSAAASRGGKRQKQK